MKYQDFSKASIAFILCMTVVRSLRAEASPPKSKLPKPVDDVLWWLPEDTQTLIVAQGPFQLDVPDQNARVDSLGLERSLQPGPARTLSKRGNLDSCAPSHLFVYRSPCSFIADSARRGNHGAQSAYRFG